MPTTAKKWKFVLSIAVILAVIGVLGYGLLLVSFSGGVASTLLNAQPAPNMQSSHLVSSRQQATSVLHASLAQLESANGLVSQGTSLHDVCYKGRNSWQQRDGYAHRCTYRITNFYGFNGDFKQRLLDFEQKLDGIGWRSDDAADHPLQAILRDYYDQYYGDKNPQMSAKFGGHYLVSNLPTPSYAKDDQTMQLGYAEAQTTDVSGLKFIQNVSGATSLTTYDNKTFQDVDQLFQAITASNTYVLAVSVQQTYYQN
jgi:hypothetical protein